MSSSPDNREPPAGADAAAPAADSGHPDRASVATVEMATPVEEAAGELSVVAVGGRRVVAELVAVLDAGCPAAAGWTARDRILAAAWLAGFRSARTRRAYSGDLNTWLVWLGERGVDVLAACRVHVDLFSTELLAAGAANATVARRLSALSSYYRHLNQHDLIPANPAAVVRRPWVDPDHSATVGLDRDQARALLHAADADFGPARLCTAAIIRLLLYVGLRGDELTSADTADLGHNRGHRILIVTRKGGHRAEVVLPPTVAAAVDTYLADRTAVQMAADTAADMATTPGVASANTATGMAGNVVGGVATGDRVATVTGPLVATSTGRRLDQAALWHLVRRLARAAGIPQWATLSPHSLRHTAITLALDAGASLRDVQDYAGHRDPRTTRRYDRSRGNLDRNAAYALVTYLS